MAETDAFVAGMDKPAFCADPKTVKAIQLNFIVIGEAVGHMPDAILAAHPQVPWHLMKAMRNRLVHVYFSVDPQIVWDTIQNDLPPLRDALTRLLRTGA